MLPLGFPLPPTPPTPKTLSGDQDTKDPLLLPFPSVSSACPFTLGHHPGAARPAHEPDHPCPRPWPIFSPQFPGPGGLALPPSPLAWPLIPSLSDSGPWTAALVSPGSLLEMRVPGRTRLLSPTRDPQNRSLHLNEMPRDSRAR